MSLFITCETDGKKVLENHSDVIKIKGKRLSWFVMFRWTLFRFTHIFLFFFFFSRVLNFICEGNKSGFSRAMKKNIKLLLNRNYLPRTAKNQSHGGNLAKSPVSSMPQPVKRSV